MNLKKYIGKNVRVTCGHTYYFGEIEAVDERDDLLLVGGTWVHADKCEFIPRLSEAA